MVNEGQSIEEVNFNNIIKLLFEFADGIIDSYYEGHNDFPNPENALELLNLFNNNFADDIVAQNLFPNIFCIVLFKKRLLLPINNVNNANDQQVQNTN